MAKLDILNVIRVTLLSALKGLANANTSALAIITDEDPIPNDFGTYRTYLSPGGVADDFGSSSDTYRLAAMIFSQVPNILTGGGFLQIIPRNQSALAQPATILSSAPVDLTKLTALDYKIKVAVDGGSASEVAIGQLNLTSLEAAEASLNVYAIETKGLEFILSGELTAANVTVKSLTDGASSTLTLSACTTGTDIAPVLNIALASATGAAAGVERVKDCVLRTAGAVDYFGIVLTDKQSDANLLELAKTIQTMDKLLFVGSSLSADLSGVFATISAAGLTHTRCLYYSNSADEALDFAAGYASRGMSINFDAGNTAHTMHLKDITGLVGDPGLTQTLLDLAKAKGVDVYADFGVAKVFTSGVNQYFDQVYIRMAFKLRLQIAGFNYLAQTAYKIPQTEEGMNGLKGAYRKVCQTFVNCGVFAPGAWNGSTTFGNPEDHIRNIKDVGYYIYSSAIASQSQASREARVAPVVQIACKDAGAIHSSDVIVAVEA